MTSHDITVAKDNSITTLVPTRTWADVLTPIIPDEDSLIVIVPDDILADAYKVSEYTRKELQKRVTFEMREQLSTEQKHALAQLVALIEAFEKKDKYARIRKDSRVEPYLPGHSLDKPDIQSRLLTLVAFSGIPFEIIVNDITEAVMICGWHYTFDFSAAYDTVCGVLQKYADSNEPVQPSFNNDDYPRMAEFIHQTPGIGLMTASGERDFFVGHSAIPLALVNAMIQKHLEDCHIWDAVHNHRAIVNNKMISEVRGALARKYPRWQVQTTQAEQQSTTTLTITAIATPVTEFANSELVLTRGAWTSSAALWAAWQTWFELNSQPNELSIHEVNFFKSLTKWAGGKIERSRRGADRVPGYAGIALRQK